MKKKGLSHVGSSRLLTRFLRFIFKFFNKYQKNNLSEAEIKKDIEIASTLRHHLACQLNLVANSGTERGKTD
ncbi:MAG: hypothetical protein WC594_03295 [Thermodesulfovibrionales bacterium]